jgi:hypothetical protein
MSENFSENHDPVLRICGQVLSVILHIHDLSYTAQ